MPFKMTAFTNLTQRQTNPRFLQSSAKTTTIQRLLELTSLHALTHNYALLCLGFTPGFRHEPLPDSFRMPRSKTKVMPRSKTKVTASAEDTTQISLQHSFQLRLLSVFGICTICTRTLSNFSEPAMSFSAS